MTVLLAVAVVVLVLVVAVPLTLLVGTRTQNRTILRAFRRFVSRFLNPRQLQTAGTPGSFAAALHHRGRVSGREYVTPIGATATDGGFLVVLPYGPDTDWLRNLQAAGSATLDFEGDTYAIDEPHVVPIGSTTLATTEARTITLFGIRSALSVRARRL